MRNLRRQGVVCTGSAILTPVPHEALELIRNALFPEGVDLVSLAKSDDLAGAVDPDALAPDLEVAFATPGGPFTEYRGIDGLLDGWRDWLSPWSSFRIHIDELVDGGERVAALVTLSGETHHEHVRIEQPAAAVFSVSAGKIVRVEFHLDQREALAAAGLPA